MPRLTPRPAAFLVEQPHGAPTVMLDHAKAVEHAAWRHGTVEGLVRESLLAAAHERIQALEQELRAAGRS